MLASNEPISRDPASQKASPWTVMSEIMLTEITYIFLIDDFFKNLIKINKLKKGLLKEEYLSIYAIENETNKSIFRDKLIQDINKISENMGWEKICESSPDPVERRKIREALLKDIALKLIEEFQNNPVIAARAIMGMIGQRFLSQDKLNDYIAITLNYSNFFTLLGSLEMIKLIGAETSSLLKGRLVLMGQRYARYSLLLNSLGKEPSIPDEMKSQVEAMKLRIDAFLEEAQEIINAKLNVEEEQRKIEVKSDLEKEKTELESKNTNKSPLFTANPFRSSWNLAQSVLNLKGKDKTETPKEDKEESEYSEENKIRNVQEDEAKIDERIESPAQENSLDENFHEVEQLTILERGHIFFSQYEPKTDYYYRQRHPHFRQLIQYIKGADEHGMQIHIQNGIKKFGGFSLTPQRYSNFLKEVGTTSFAELQLQLANISFETPVENRSVFSKKGK